MKVESNWTKTRYSFICEDKKDREFLDKMNKYIDGLEEENKKLREELSAYDREYFDEDKKAKNIFKEDDTYIYNAKEVRDIC